MTTNHIENQWAKLDKHIKSYQGEAFIDQYIDQYCYYKSRNLAALNDGERFGTFLYDVIRTYPGLPRKPVIPPNETYLLYGEP